jgi:hypothetical protein
MDWKIVEAIRQTGEEHDRGEAGRELNRIMLFV